MRIQGRTLRPSNLAERRVMLSLGLDHFNFRVRRGINPFVVARHVRKLASGVGGDRAALQALLARNTRPHPIDLPDSTSAPCDAPSRAA
jgi:hypothetical protein